MSGTAIVIENLSKKYTISHQTPERYTALRDVIAKKAKKMAQKILFPLRAIKSDSSKEEFWALKNLSFEVTQGEVLGIIGRNGAGKTTLLKILSRITEPTMGRFRIKGRVASLLEVGTGFHPELTGRENIFLNGAILGMKRHEMKKKFDEIVAFSEVEKFLDTPVKRYSSGMYVRLAFAVAAHLEPEILLVDEVLAVGDAQFQKKCLGKMQAVGSEGRTVLFVSHNMTALRSLCEKAIWLNGGTVVESGYAKDVVSNYLQNNLSVNMCRVWDDPAAAPGNRQVSLYSVKILHENEEDGKGITVASPIDLEVEFFNYEPGSLLNLSLVLYDNQDVCIFNTCSEAKAYPAGKVKSVCHIPGNFMNDGIYRVRLLIVKDQSVALVDLDNIVSFEVHDAERRGAWYGKWIGAVRPKFNWDSFYIG